MGRKILLKSFIFIYMRPALIECFFWGVDSLNHLHKQCPTFFEGDILMKKGVQTAEILAIVLSLPKEHPKRNSLINLMNTACRMSGTLPKDKEDRFMDIVKGLKKEGVL